jgi:hypothetical protein
MLIDDPVHELEACKRHWEDDSTVLVNVRSRHAKHLVQLLHVTVRIHRRRWWYSRRGGGAYYRRRRRTLHEVYRRQRQWHRRRFFVVPPATSAASHALLLRVHSAVPRMHFVLSTSRMSVVVLTVVVAVTVVVVVPADGVLSGAPLAMHFGIMDIEMNRLEWKSERKSRMELVLTPSSIGASTNPMDFVKGHHYCCRSSCCRSRRRRAARQCSSGRPVGREENSFVFKIGRERSLDSLSLSVSISANEISEEITTTYVRDRSVYISSKTYVWRQHLI